MPPEGGEGGGQQQGGGEQQQQQQQGGQQQQQQGGGEQQQQQPPPPPNPRLTRQPGFGVTPPPNAQQQQQGGEGGEQQQQQQRRQPDKGGEQQQQQRGPDFDYYTLDFSDEKNRAEAYKDLVDNEFKDIHKGNEGMKESFGNLMTLAEKYQVHPGFIQELVVGQHKANEEYDSDRLSRLDSAFQKDKELGGKNMDQAKDNAKKALLAFDMDASYIEELTESGMLRDVRFARLLNRAYDAYRNAPRTPRPVIGDTSGTRGPMTHLERQRSQAKALFGDRLR